MLDLENDLPDELMSSSPWGIADNMTNAKPPAQGPGPGGLQNGIDNSESNNLRQQMQLNHLLQQVCLLVLKIYQDLCVLKTTNVCANPYCAYIHGIDGFRLQRMKLHFNFIL